MAWRENTANALDWLGNLGAAGSALHPGFAIGGIALKGLGSLLRPSAQPNQANGPYQQAQMSLLQQLQQPTPPFDIGALQNLARQNFMQQIVPGIAERFSGIGGQRSSAFGQQLGGAGANLQAQLAGLGPQWQLRRQQLEQNRLGALENLLGRQQQYGLAQQQLAGQGAQRQNTFIQNLLAGFGQYNQNQQEQARQRAEAERLAQQQRMQLGQTTII